MLQIGKSQAKASVISKVLLAFGLIGLGWGCSRPPHDPSQVAIVGGQPVAPGEFESVVALVTQAEHAAHWTLLCSGTLISPQVILTAAHCLDDVGGVSAETLEISRPKLRLGIARGSGVDGGHFEHVLPVAGARVYPYFREHPLGIGDVALLFLTEPLTDVAPIRIPTTLTDSTASISQGRVTLVGFGRREDRAMGLKYKVETPRQGLTPLEALAGGDGRDACDGDSGGPALGRVADGPWWLAGVVARGTSFECGLGGILTITSQVSCWIKQTVTAALSTEAFPFDVDACQGPSPTYSDDELEQHDFESICTGTSGSGRQQANARNMAQVLADGECQKAASRLRTDQELDLSGALLDDISPLAGAPELRVLHLRGNFLTHVDPLRSLPQLAQVDLTGNLIQDPERLAQLRRQNFKVRGLRRQLGLYGHTAFLAACQSQETSSSARRTIQAIMWKTLAEDCVTANQRLLSIKSLSLKDRDLKDLSPLFGLEHLTSLNLSGNPIEDVSPLAASESLRFLDLTGTAVEDLSPLDGLMADGLSIRRL